MTYGYAPFGGQVTGEAVELELRPARLASRTLAFLLDLLVQLGLLFVLSVAYGVLGLHLDSDLAATIGLLVLLTSFLGYPIALETLWRGRTLGKAALGLRVVRDDGGPAPFTSIVIREVEGLLVDKLLLLGLIGILTMVSSERAKRLGDMLAGTVVISERIPGQESLAIEMPPPLVGWAQTLDLSRVPDSLGLAIRQFLGRAAQLDPAARDRVGNQLLMQLASLTSPPPPPGTPGWAFLAAVIAERRRREELSGRVGSAAPVGATAPTGTAAPISYGVQPPYSPPVAATPPPPPAPGPGGFAAPV
jgi:uncharacterized RDD family membrane protein YckC